MWHREDLIWLAGIFEGEGCITIRAGKTATLTVSMTDEDVVLRVQQAAKLGTVNGPYNKGPGRKPMWTWDLHRREHVYALLVAMYPWLGNRRKEKAREVFTIFASLDHGLGCGPGRCRRGHDFAEHGTPMRWLPDRNRYVMRCRKCDADTQRAKRASRK